MQLAVDDLRTLQESYGRLSVARPARPTRPCELAQYRLDEKSAELEKLQSLLEQKGLFVGDLGEQRRRMQDILGRMDSDMRLLEEKGKNMVSRLSDMRMQLSATEKQRADAASRSASGRSRRSCPTPRVREESLRRHGRRARVDTSHEGRRAPARARRASSAGITAEEREARAEADRETLAYAKLEEQISSAEVEDQMFASRLEQIDEAVRNAEEVLDQPP